MKGDSFRRAVKKLLLGLGICVVGVSLIYAAGIFIKSNILLAGVMGAAGLLASFFGLGLSLVHSLEALEERRKSRLRELDAEDKS